MRWWWALFACLGWYCAVANAGDTGEDLVPLELNWSPPVAVNPWAHSDSNYTRTYRTATDLHSHGAMLIVDTEVINRSIYPDREPDFRVTMFYTEDAGRSWAPNESFNALNVDYRYPSLLADHRGNFAVFTPQATYSSRDSGRTWTRHPTIHPLAAGLWIDSVTRAPGKAIVVAWSTQQPNPPNALTTSLGISEDGGQSWLYRTFPERIRTIAGIPDGTWIAASDQTTWRSRDNGHSWQLLKNNSFRYSSTNEWLSGFRLSADARGTIMAYGKVSHSPYADSDAGMRVSADGGDSWGPWRPLSTSDEVTLLGDGALLLTSQSSDFQTTYSVSNDYLATVPSSTIAEKPDSIFDHRWGRLYSAWYPLASESLSGTPAIWYQFSEDQGQTYSDSEVIYPAPDSPYEIFDTHPRISTTARGETSVAWSSTVDRRDVFIESDIVFAPLNADLTLPVENPVQLTHDESVPYDTIRAFLTGSDGSKLIVRPDKLSGFLFAKNAEAEWELTRFDDFANIESFHAANANGNWIAMLNGGFSSSFTHLLHQAPDASRWSIREIRPYLDLNGFTKFYPERVGIDNQGAILMVGKDYSTSKQELQVLAAKEFGKRLFRVASFGPDRPPLFGLGVVHSELSDQFTIVCWCRDLNRQSHNDTVPAIAAVLTGNGAFLEDNRVTDLVYQPVKISKQVPVRLFSYGRRTFIIAGNLGLPPNAVVTDYAAGFWASTVDGGEHWRINAPPEPPVDPDPIGFWPTDLTIDRTGRVMCIGTEPPQTNLGPKQDTDIYLYTAQWPGVRTTDVDGNDVTNSVDIQLVINALLLGSDPAFDTNGDGTVDATDVQAVINAVLTG